MSGRTNPVCYMAGPITGMTYKGAVDWRDYASDQLNAVGILALSPMRQEEYLSDHQLLPEMADRFNGVKIAPKGVVIRDRFDGLLADHALDVFG